MKKGFKNLLMLVLTFVFANPGYAVCDLERLKVVRSEGPSSGGVFVYDFAPAAVLPTFYYRFSTSDAQIINNLNTAWLGRFAVRVVGDAAACGETDTIRSGGTITFLFVDSFF